MQTGARYVGVTCLVLGLVLCATTAEADLISPVDSTFALTATSQVGSSQLVTYNDVQSRGSTLNPMSVAVSALSSDYSTLSSLLVTGQGSATWTSASKGEVTFSNLGWYALNVLGNAPGLADLSQNVGWVYTFKSNVTGSFNINYSITASGASSTNNRPLSGLVNGFFIYEGAGTSAPSLPNVQTGLTTPGSATMAITAGNIYTVEIQNDANISGDIGTSYALMNGTFDFNVVAAPEPSSLAVAIAVSCLGGIAAFLKRRRQFAKEL